MRVAVVMEHRFERTPDGRVWTEGPFPYTFFERYLEVFDAVRVLARVKTVAHRGEGKRLETTGPGVEVHALPPYVGPAEYALRRRAVRDALQSGLAREDPVILRVPSQVATLAAALLRAAGRPYAAEVVGDPHDALAPGATKHPLRACFRYLQSRALAQQCREAAATAYVTREALQRRYPPKSGGFSTTYSSVELRDDAFVVAPPAAADLARRFISVGSMEHYYKGYDTLLEALAICRADGLGLHLTLVGDGRLRGQFERRATAVGVDRAVRFAGQAASGAAVRGELDAAEVFVLASRQEGLPRALLEAMARGLPAVATNVGGIPELVARENRVDPDDPERLARLLKAVAADRGRRERMAREGLKTARLYHDRLLAPNRRELYRTIAALSHPNGRQVLTQHGAPAY